RAGFVLCHGGPGTGKTHFVIQAVRPFFLDAKRHRILLTGATNSSVDSTALGLREQLESMITGSGSALRQYIVRLHSIKTEMSIILREAKLARQRNLDAKKAKPSTANA